MAQQMLTYNDVIMSNAFAAPIFDHINFLIFNFFFYFNFFYFYFFFFSCNTTKFQGRGYKNQDRERWIQDRGHKGTKGTMDSRPGTQGNEGNDEFKTGDTRIKTGNDGFKTRDTR